MKYLNLLLILIILFFIAASCYKSPVITGNIFDYDTGRPVTGAVVKFYYRCAKSDCKEKYGTGITDNNGRYKIIIEDEIKPVEDKFYIEVQKDGYITLYDNYNITKDNKLSIYLKGISS
jgi:hypothetical protein